MMKSLFVQASVGVPVELKADLGYIVNHHLPQSDTYQEFYPCVHEDRAKCSILEAARIMEDVQQGRNASRAADPLPSHASKTAFRKRDSNFEHLEQYDVLEREADSCFHTNKLRKQFENWSKTKGILISTASALNIQIAQTIKEIAEICSLNSIANYRMEELCAAVLAERRRAQSYLADLETEQKRNSRLVDEAEMLRTQLQREEARSTQMEIALQSVKSSLSGPEQLSNKNSFQTVHVSNGPDIGTFSKAKLQATDRHQACRSEPQVLEKLVSKSEAQSWSHETFSYAKVLTEDKGQNPGFRSPIQNPSFNSNLSSQVDRVQSENGIPNSALDSLLSEVNDDQAAFHRARCAMLPATVGLTSAVRAHHPANALLRTLGTGVCGVALQRSAAFGSGTMIVLERELLFSDVSDGLPQPVVVAAARLDGGAPFCVKLRSADPVQGHPAGARGSSAVELDNLLAVSASPAARQLFPRLLFHFRLDLPAGGGSWMGIGVEMVQRSVPEALTEDNWRLVAALLPACARHLRRLHAAGLAHGDAHTGNLMYNERRLPTGAVGLQPLCIDADRVRPLGRAGGLGALRQWADIQQLLYWNNPLLGGAVRRLEGWSWRDVFAALHADAAVQRLSFGTVPPTDYFMDMENVEQLAAFIADPAHRGYLSKIGAIDSVSPGGVLDVAVARLCADGCSALAQLGNAIRTCIAQHVGNGRERDSQSMIV